jgi:hypothetical protein
LPLSRQVERRVFDALDRTWLRLLQKVDFSDDRNFALRADFSRQTAYASSKGYYNAFPLSLEFLRGCVLQEEQALGIHAIELLGR